MTALRAVDDYLATFLAPLRPYLAWPDTTDLYVNGAGEIWVERGVGRIDRHAVPALTDDWLWHLSQQMARAADQGISRAEPLLSATLPCGTRVQVVAPPATRTGFAMAFRRQVTAAFTLADLGATAMFDGVGARAAEDPDAELDRLHAAGDHIGFLAAAVARRKTIIVSGGTASGKTTLVNALLREVPMHERIVAIEDSAELLLAQPNAVGLIATRGALGESHVDADDLLRAALRLRPDRIVLGEVRGPEALTFLRAVNTGHPGSLTTIHADSPKRALDQLGMLALQGGARIDTSELRAYIDRLVDVVVQLERTPQGRRVVAVDWRRASA
ncbi:MULTISPECIES: P-type DNA transfer ATPase VirB11 [unclassified Sphingomonas]|uniref:P-type DNA transfer ATPase VirB11 n=1 Tax=unclassified Sphingomonas TaxID=196159 RepID=UPI00226A0643|nr:MULTISPECIES: P-type DNA transfer ATPase VirB11 [unclassified Sphingomonas]